MWKVSAAHFYFPAAIDNHMLRHLLMHEFLIMPSPPAAHMEFASNAKISPNGGCFWRRRSRQVYVLSTVLPPNLFKLITKYCKRTKKILAFVMQRMVVQSNISTANPNLSIVMNGNNSSRIFSKIFSVPPATSLWVGNSDAIV